MKIDFTCTTTKVLDMKLLTLINDDAITSIGYGPYDNGYLLLGLKSGFLLIIDPLSLQKVIQISL